MTAWTLVANGTAARIYRSQDRHDFTEIETFINPANRQHERDLKSDRYGQAQSSASGHSESYTEASVKAQERERFASELADHLADAHRQQAFDTLNLVCSPKILGLVRQRLAPAVAAVVRHEVSKNLVAHASGDILAHLQASD